jgi:hypothetical protein
MTMNMMQEKTKSRLIRTWDASCGCGSFTFIDTPGRTRRQQARRQAVDGHRKLLQDHSGGWRACRDARISFAAAGQATAAHPTFILMYTSSFDTSSF